MHSFYPSRGKVFFEVLCALGISASLAGAWLQTHATALMGAAGVAALYALVHLFDMRRPKVAEIAEPQRIAFEPETSDIVVPMVAVEAEPMAETVVGGVDVVDTRASNGRRSGGSRKGAGRRAKAPKTAKVVELAPVEELETPGPLTLEPQEQEHADPGEEDFEFPSHDELSQSHIAPLFEPEPFARMQRRAFGRRGRL